MKKTNMVKTQKKTSKNVLDMIEFESDLLLNGGQDGHSQLFIEEYKETIKTITESGSGYVYDEFTALWVERSRKYIVNMIPKFLKKEIKKRFNKAIDKNDITVKAGVRTINETINLLKKLFKEVSKYNHCNNVFNLAQPKLYDISFIEKLNGAKHLLPIVGNLVMNLKTCTTRTRTKKDMFSFECPVSHLDNSDLSNAEKFFSEIMCNDIPSCDYLQKCLGYCMTGETSERCFFIWWGGGSNGKSSLTELLDQILQKFCVSCSPKVLIHQEKNGSATPHLIPLIGARLAILSETDKNEKLNQKMIKKLTGNDKISARALYGKQVEFKPVCKTIMLTNNRPIFNSDDTAMVDRLKYNPFNQRFVCNPIKGELKKDPEFIEKLKTEYLNEVFTWLCIGAKKWYDNKNLNPPEIVQSATDEYISELDVISRFMDENCEFGSKYTVKRSYLFEYFKTYCRENAIFMRKKEFFNRMQKKGYKNERLKEQDNCMGYRGFKICEDEDENERNKLND